MSSIDKLLIQGIRSFGSLDSEKAIIQFGIPLTLITGQNGAGKTTIIECLKYVTTGDQPPNTKGGAFVHDPKLVGERDVRAVVKLRFRDISGHTVTCHRMLQALQKPKKIEMKTLDSSLQKNVDGEVKKLTSRVGEIDKEMIDHLGVSKAILNHVIFCHQEEATWPLGESKPLKQKFDEIFASTRYSKALDAILKLQKEKNQECKEHTIELDYLKKQKLKAEELEGDLKDMQRKVECSKAEIMRISRDLRPIEERKQEMDEMYGEADSMKTKIAELESSKRELDRTLADLSKKISKPFSGSREELQRLRDDHRHQLDRSKREFENMEQQGLSVSENIKLAEQQVTLLYQEQGRKEMAHKNHLKLVESRDGQITSLGKQLHVEGYMKAPFSAESVKQFLGEVDERIRLDEERARQEKLHFSQKDEDLQKQINELSTNLALINQSLKTKEKAVADDREKMKTIGRKLTSLGSGGSALEGIQKELMSAERELEEVRLQTNIPQMEESQSKLRSEKKKADEEMSQLQQELSVISRQLSSRGALDALRKDKRAKEERYQNEMSSMEAELLTVLGRIPAPDDRDLPTQLANIERSKNNELKSYQDQYEKGRIAVSRLQAQLEETERQLKSERRKVEALNKVVSEECGDGADYDQTMEKLRQDIKANADDLSAVKGSMPFFRKSLEKMHSTRKCPLCTRGFDDNASFEKTVKSITDRLNNTVPRLLPTLEDKQRELQEKQKRLQELKPKIEELNLIQGREIPRLEAVKGQKEAEIKKLQAQLKRDEEKLSGLRVTLDQVRGLQPRVLHTSQLSRDLEELDAKIGSEESKLGSSNSSRSHLLVNRELQEAQMKAEELERKMDHKMQQIHSGMQEIRQLGQRVNQLRDEKLRLQEQLQEKQGLLTKKEELAVIIQTNEREIKMTSQQYGPVEEKLRGKERERKALCQNRDEAEAVSKAELDTLKSAVDTIKTSTKQISKYMSEGGESGLQELNAKIDEFSKEIAKKKEQRNNLEQRKNQLMKQVTNAELQEREWEDQLQLMRVQSDIVKKEREAQKLREKMREMGLDKYDDEYLKLQREQDRLTKERAHKDGVKQGQEDRVRGLQRELQGDMYKDAERKHKEMLIMLRTTEMASKDLEKYYKVLDRAIMRFHKLKMEEINKIVKELWMKTYRGGDIDTIEIRSADDDPEDSGVIKTRRVYHYRVVMLKGHTVLDMRGRCSAGQKVLASIIIRLALAETFCVNCGLLALDEPTTNLDRENIEGLAQALADIVKDRSSQKNFQLIVITHDMEFVDVLGQAGYTEYYYKVSKEVGDTSRIRKLPLSGGIEH